MHSLFCNSSDDFLSLRLTWHIHHTICMSVRAILVTSLFFSGQVLLPYCMTLLTLVECNFPFVLCKNSLHVRRGKSTLNFFQPDLMRDIELASAFHQDKKTGEEPHAQHCQVEPFYHHHLQ